MWRKGTVCGGEARSNRTFMYSAEALRRTRWANCGWTPSPSQIKSQALGLGFIIKCFDFSHIIQMCSPRHLKNPWKCCLLMLIFFREPGIVAHICGWRHTRDSLCLYSLFSHVRITACFCSLIRESGILFNTKTNSYNSKLPCIVLSPVGLTGCLILND